MKQSGRELDRELMNLKRQEQQIMAEIQKALKSHQDITAKSLAKTLIQNRKQQERFLKTKGQVSALQHKTTAMASQSALQQAMKTSADVMTRMNQQFNVQQTQNVMREFQKQAQTSDMKEEMMDDMMDNVFDDDEEEVDEAMNQVLDEIGINISNTKVGSSKLKTQQVEEEEEDEDELLQKLAALKK